MSDAVRPLGAALHGRIAVALIATAVVWALTLNLLQSAVIGILFAPVVGIPLALVLLAATVAAGSYASWIAVRRRNLPAVIVSVLLSAAVTLVTFLSHGTGDPLIPSPVGFTGVTQFGDLTPFLIGIVGALASAWGFRPWPWKLVGCLASAALLASLFVLAAFWRAPAQDAEARAAAADAAYDKKMIDFGESLIAQGTPPLTSDVDGYPAAFVDLRDYGSVVTLEAADGTAIDIRVEIPNEFSDDPAYACSTLALDAPGSHSLESYAGTCARVGDARWEYLDGTKVALRVDGRMVFITGLGWSDQSNSASYAAVVHDVADHLRALTSDELRILIENDQRGHPAG